MSNTQYAEVSSKIQEQSNGYNEEKTFKKDDCRPNSLETDQTTQVVPLN